VSGHIYFVRQKRAEESKQVISALGRGRCEVDSLIRLALRSDSRNVRSVFFLVSWGGVRMSPFGTSATNWPIVPAPDDR
jgi:hypothetical protein